MSTNDCSQLITIMQEPPIYIHLLGGLCRLLHVAIYIHACAREFIVRLTRVYKKENRI